MLLSLFSRRRAGFLVAGLAALSLGVTGTPATAGVGHGRAVVQGVPRASATKILDGTVYAGAQVGRYVVYGGDFTTVQLGDSSRITQRYLAAFDLATGQLVKTFRPVLDGVVLTLEPGDTADTVFVGGEFLTANGTAVKRLTKLSVKDGSRVTAFHAEATSKVTTLARFGTRLFVGGEFGSIRGVSRSKLAEISTVNGAVAAGFTVGITGKRDSGYRADGFFKPSGGPVVRALRVSPDGSRLVVAHRGDLVGGQRRWGVAVINISGTATLLPWRTQLWERQSFRFQNDFVSIQDADLSPDGTMFVVSNDGGNFPPLHDSVIALPVGPTTLSNTDVQPLWVTQNFDSTYSVAISDAAVYAGGHFCWTESQQALVGPLVWPGSSGNRYSCQDTSGSVFQPRTTYRYHLEALDLPTGRALPWDPQSRSFRGVTFLRTVAAGLLVGHDGMFMGGSSTGRAGYFPLP